MGEIRDKAADVFRDFLVNGVPASGPNEPYKPAIRELLGTVDDRIAGAVAGLKPYASKAALDADTTQPIGTLATLPNDGVYRYASGGWVRDSVLSNAFFGANVQVTGDKNLFNAAAALVGNEIEFSGRIGIESNSVASQPIYVGDFAAITISGLAPNPALSRVYAFYTGLPADETKFISYGQIAGNGPLTIAVPEGAQYMRFSPKQRQSGTVSLAAVQVEAGLVATDYQTFTPRILTVSGQITGQRPEPAFVRDARFSGALNLFNKDTVFTPGEIQFNGGLYLEDNSVSSAPIYVGDLPDGSPLTFSGMAPNPAIDRVGAFYSDTPTGTNAADPALISYFQIAAGATYSIAKAAGAQWMRFSARQRQPGAGSYALTQLEAAAGASAFQPYREALVEWAGRSVGRESGASAVSSIGIMAMFGDSITQTADVDNGKYVHGSGFKANWPDYAVPLLAPSTAYNFAKSGAAFANISGATNWQKFDYQVTTAIAQNITPTCVVVALGINDLRSVSTLGDYDTAMGKAINSLDLTVSIEAARKGFYRLQQAWPDAVKFVSLPLQNMDRPLPALQTFNDLIARMARRYGFTVIDAFSESGIVADFEVNSGQGQDLVDGLHPDASGQRKQGRLIAARVRARLIA